MIKFRTQTEIRQNRDTFADPKQIALHIEGEDWQKLKIAARKLDTTQNEIIRCVLHEWLNVEAFNLILDERIFYRVQHGISEKQDDGSLVCDNIKEQGALFVDVGAAKNDLSFWFEHECQELRKHNPRRTKREIAFARLVAVSGVSDVNPDGQDATRLLTPQQKQQMDNAALTLDGATL